MNKTTCFVAYPSIPLSLAETIEAAIEKIRLSEVVDIVGWKTCFPSGQFLMPSICETININDIFICDLTSLNFNVLFELGYAIAKNKKIWTLFNPDIEISRIEHNKLNLLESLKHSHYSNSEDIVENFYSEEPYDDLDNTIYNVLKRSAFHKPDQQSILYLKSDIETEASIKLSMIIANSKLPRIIDDPIEVKIQTLSWYFQQVNNAFAVIIHLTSQIHKNSRFHNAKNSLIAGLAYGFNKPILMLAHEPFESPIDYCDLLKRHTTAAECEYITKPWLNEIEKLYFEQKEGIVQFKEIRLAHAELNSIYIGDPFAENEQKELIEYFVPTAAYSHALLSRNSLFIGRKGSGKTAILFKLEDDLKYDKRNHVCVIKPIAYELEGVLFMIDRVMQECERGNLIESFWKFIIYSELAKSVYDKIISQPSYYSPDKYEQELINLVDENKNIILSDFTIRLESVVKKLNDLDIGQPFEKQRLRISEMLHENIIGKLRYILGEILHKNNKVVILIDNLDRAWKPRGDIQILSSLLFGLIGVCERITRDFDVSTAWRSSANLSIILFLRSDIFTSIIKNAREKDKISHFRIIWDDPDTLIRVLEERFIASSTQITTNDIWIRYFCSSVKGIGAKTYLTKYILPRPRDLIYLAKEAQHKAANRGHSKIEESDILDAMKKYSQFALDSIIVENSIQVTQLEELLYEFVGMTEIITKTDILSSMKKCDIDESELGHIIDILCNLTFIGLEVEPDRFVFLYNEEEEMKIKAMARKTVEKQADRIERFKINDAFHSYLEIKSTM